MTSDGAVDVEKEAEFLVHELGVCVGAPAFELGARPGGENVQNGKFSVAKSSRPVVHDNQMPQYISGRID